MLRITLASLHLIALGLGLGAVIARGTALREAPSPGALRRALRADAMWGIAALLWISTGLWRYLGAVEKSVSYYNVNHLFLGKMTLLVVVLALEVWPMMTLIRWRAALGRGSLSETAVPTRTARRIATISHVQALIVVLMVVAAAAMARGIGVH
jgi:putative membrane protein